MLKTISVVRISTFNSLCFLLATVLCSSSFVSHASSKATPVPTVHIQSIDIEGLSKSNRVWFESILGITAPCDLSEKDLKQVRDNIVATRLFSYAELKIRGESLAISVEEKWTLIPVLRAKSGGGTPLLVAGAYESHLFGRQGVLGAEFRRYGQAPWGGLVYTQLPHLLGQHSLLQIETSRLHRIRTFYDKDQRSLGNLETDEQGNRLLFLSPTYLFDEHFRVGVDFQYLNLRGLPTEDGGPPPTQGFSHFNQKYKLLPALEYDDLVVDNVIFNGVRSLNKIGLIFGGADQNQHMLTELELFYYKAFHETLNLALHGFFGSSDSRAMQAQYFLGGFDSVRGIPDGAIWGNKAFYTNVEVLQLFMKRHYVWLQAALFADFGEAAQRWEDLAGSHRTSFGAGLRLAIPQIYRLVLRFDYAWNIETGSRGISLGFNQFFQPYTPSISP